MPNSIDTSIKTTPALTVKKPDILVDCLRINGFRGIKNLEITFSTMTVLIGPNNSGKTTILKALGLALGDYGRYIEEEDFYFDAFGQENETRPKEIVVDARIVPLDAEGQQSNEFDQNWQAEFGDKIKAEADGKQYVPIRTKVFPNSIKGGFQTERYSMEKWPAFANWLEGAGKLSKMAVKFDSIPFFSIEAQRDIHSELKDKSSFIGKVLSGVKYDKDVIVSLEKTIDEINKEAVEKSDDLKRLKSHLTQLNQTFQGAGSAEITPFPKKVRDLSKNFTVHFGETLQSTFPMEYHGMGTRSWASMLTVRAFMDTLRATHEEDAAPYFPILAAEEPEAHLHPNAQKTLYNQLLETNAQVIVSTHSPYFTAMPDIEYLRALRRTDLGIMISKLHSSVSAIEKKILSREILARRGEILFSRALILCEGMTEEQVIPTMFEIYSNGQSLYHLGISCISVGGKNYAPFIKLACSLGIPTYVISDNDGTTKAEVEAQIQKLTTNHLPLTNDSFGISYCFDGNDFEAELINILRMRDEVVEALVLCETDATDNVRYKSAKELEIKALSDSEIIERMRKAKTAYSGFLADVIRQKLGSKTKNELIVKAAFEAFDAIKDGYLHDKFIPNPRKNC